MSGQAGRYQRSFGGLVTSMVVLVVAVLAFVGWRSLFRGEAADPVQAVDYATPARFAAEQAPYPLLAPDPLPEGWKATSVRFDPTPYAAWHVGMLTADEKYVGLEQADRPVGPMVDDFVDEEATKAGTATVGGQEWTVWTDSGGDRALVRHEGDATTLVVGPVDQDVLEQLLTSLKAPSAA